MILSRQNTHRRAVILVLSMWMVLVLSLLAYSLAVEMRVEMKLTKFYRDQFKAEQLARIGVARAMADLRNDDLFDLARNEVQWEVYDALGDIWAGSLKPRENKVPDIGKYQTLIVDEESKLSLNSYNPEWREVMRNILIFLKVDEKDAQQLADAIWDWKDYDNDPMGAQGDKETTYYAEVVQKLGGSKDIKEVHPKNAPFNTVEELLQIPGMTPEIFYGYNPEKEKTPDFFPTQSTRSHRKKMPGLRDLVSVRTDTLNINTANFEVLASLCAYATKNVQSGRSLAEKIITFRQGGRDTNIDNNHAFRRLEDLELVSGMSAGFVALMKQAVPQLTTASENFTIYCRAEVSGRNRQSYSTGSSRSAQASPLPSARVIAQCKRSILIYDLDAFEEKSPPPGCKRQSQMRIAAGPSLPASYQWFIPVTYLMRWTSE